MQGIGILRVVIAAALVSGVGCVVEGDGFELGEARQSLTVSTSVPSGSNVWGAGRSTIIQSDFAQGGGYLPVEVPIPSGATEVRFGNTSGTIALQSGGRLPVSADGRSGTFAVGDEFWDYEGIQGYLWWDRGIGLSGVFLDDDEPSDPAPAVLRVTRPRQPIAQH